MTAPVPKWAPPARRAPEATGCPAERLLRAPGGEKVLAQCDQPSTHRGRHTALGWSWRREETNR